MILKMLEVGPFPENTYIVGSESSGLCAIIDPGAQAKLILDELETLGLKAKYLVNTHGHFDHTGAIAAVKEGTGASYGIHEGDEFLIKATEEAGRAYIPGFRSPPNPDFYLKEGDVLDLGDVTLTVIGTPGHTPGSVCFSVPGMVFTGDTLFLGSIGRYDFPGSNGKLLIQNIKTKLLALPDDTLVFPGHGPQTTIGDEKLWNPFLV